jgi:cytochrome c553
MMKKTITLLGLLAMFFATSAFATPASDAVLAKYKAEGVSKTDVAKAKKDWTLEVVVDGEKMSCASCHGTDFTKPGKHHKTGKVIEPMSSRVTADRYTEVKKIEKWFKRNCKDAWGRECTAQEKADFLTFLIAQ